MLKREMKLLKMMLIMVVMIMGVALGDIVDGTCKQTPDYTFCVTILRSDPRSSSADITGLALILVDKIKTLGIITRREIKKAYKTKPLFKGPLDECSFSYKIILEDDYQEAYQALPGNPKFAEDGIADCGAEADRCERGFPKGQSPLTSLNNRMEKISDVATTIVRMLL